MDALHFYWNSFKGYWPTARALSGSRRAAVILLICLFSIPLLRRVTGRRPRRVRLVVGDRRIDYFVRDGADISALREVFADGEYAFSGVMPDSARRIADIGAHIGASVLYFSRLYPGATIVAYEPDPNNFSILLKNTTLLPNVTCRQAAVSGKRGSVTFYPNVGSSTRSSLIKEEDSGQSITVESVSLEDVVGDGIDIIKFDTEGAEYDMFAEASHENRERVRFMVGEVHHYAIHKTRKEFEQLFPGRSFEWRGRDGHVSVVAITKP